MAANVCMVRYCIGLELAGSVHQVQRHLAQDLHCAYTVQTSHWPVLVTSSSGFMLKY